MEQTFEITEGKLKNIISEAIEKAISKLQKKDTNIKGREYIKIIEFAKIFGMTWTGVYNLIINKKIEAVRLEGARSWRIPIEEVEKYKSRSKKETNNDIFKRSF
jgi:excisionase family DNA binding protein